MCTKTCIQICSILVSFIQIYILYNLLYEVDLHKYRPCLADKYSWQPIPYDLPEGVFP